MLGALRSSPNKGKQEMEMGLLMFPSPTGSAEMAQTAEQLGFDSLVFADTQLLEA